MGEAPQTAPQRPFTFASRNPTVRSPPSLPEMRRFAVLIAQDRSTRLG